jgi:hypothetical protein
MTWIIVGGLLAAIGVAAYIVVEVVALGKRGVL